MEFTFKNKNLPKRFINAINAELNMPLFGHSTVLNHYGHSLSEPIPDWLILAWIEDNSIIRVPNLGKTTINQVLQVIIDRLTIKNPIVLHL